MVAWRQRVRQSAFAVFVSSALIAAGIPAEAIETVAGPVAAPPLIQPDTLEDRIEALIAAPVGGGKKSQAEADEQAAAKSFYTARNYAPVWVSEQGLNARAVQAIGELGRGEDFGLKASDFVLPSLKPGAPSPSRDALADAESTMTRAILKYARFARGGRIPDPSGALSEFIDRRPQLIAPLSVLEQVANATAVDAALRGFQPQHPQFEKLRHAYLKARGERRRFGDLSIPVGSNIYPGQINPAIAILRKRLGVPVAKGSEDGNPAEVYDNALVEAVRAFQAQAGLRRPDGIIGDKTRAALNADGDGPISSLLANMEQWRWMPQSLGDTYVQVNIPEFQVRLVRNGAVVHSERVVTGKVDTATPMFSAVMQTVVFQPKWGVPDSIKINELLPRLQRGGGLRSGLRMSLNGRDVDPWNVDWNRADITRYQIYQPSGDDNALGVVKFLFPNKHAVYLHDTPTKNLFNAESRAYSHGCVRVRNPVRLAELLLASDKGWDANRVRELIEDGPEDNAIKLETKIPVHITYFTAVVDDAGKVQSFPDVYGHERRITQALDGHSDQIAKLNPLPLGSGRSVNASNDEGPARRRVADTTRYAPPAALGFSPPPQPAPKSYFKSSGSGNRFRGNTPNDIVMRGLGGGF